MLTDEVLEQTIRELEARKEKIRRVLELQTDVYCMESQLIDAGSLPKACQIILAVVCHHFGVTPKEVHSRKRTKRLTIPRHVAFSIIYRDCGASQEEIGKLFDRDHTTITYANQSVEDMSKTDLRFAMLLTKLREECQSRMASELK